MSLLEFSWNLHQDGEIDSLEEQVKQLKQNMEIACKWINYLSSELEKLKDEQRRTESKTF